MSKAKELYDKIVNMELRDPDVGSEQEACEHKWRPTCPPIAWAKPGVKPTTSTAVAVCERCGTVKTL